MDNENKNEAAEAAQDKNEANTCSTQNVKKATKDKVNIKPKLNLYQKLIEIRKEVPYLQKGADGYNFKYVAGSVLLGIVRPKMDELGVLLSFDVEEISTDDVERVVKGKTVSMGRTKAKYVFTFTNAENPFQKTSKTIWTQILGDDVSDMGSLNTYSLRYFLLGFFNIPNDKEDPDQHELSKNKALPKELISKEQVKEIETLINGYEDIKIRMLKQYKKIELIEASQFEVIITTIKKLIADIESKK